MKVVFKNLKESTIVEQIVRSRIEESVSKFPELERHKLVATIYMENSPEQAGRDLFGVRLRISGPYHTNIILEKAESNMYLALAELQEALLERMRRAREKKRSKTRTWGRTIKQKVLPKVLGQGETPNQSVEMAV